jgi:hypothetical protein
MLAGTSALRLAPARARHDQLELSAPAGTVRGVNSPVLRLEETTRESQPHPGARLSGGRHTTERWSEHLLDLGGW